MGRGTDRQRQINRQPNNTEIAIRAGTWPTTQTRKLADKTRRRARVRHSQPEQGVRTEFSGYQPCLRSRPPLCRGVDIMHTSDLWHRRHKQSRTESRRWCYCADMRSAVMARTQSLWCLQTEGKHNTLAFPGQR